MMNLEKTLNLTYINWKVPLSHNEEEHKYVYAAYLSKDLRDCEVEFSSVNNRLIAEVIKANSNFTEKQLKPLVEEIKKCLFYRMNFYNTYGTIKIEVKYNAKDKMFDSITVKKPTKKTAKTYKALLFISLSKIKGPMTKAFHITTKKGQLAVLSYNKKFGYFNLTTTNNGYKICCPIRFATKKQAENFLNTQKSTAGKTIAESKKLFSFVPVPVMNEKTQQPYIVFVDFAKLIKIFESKTEEELALIYSMFVRRGFIKQ